MQHHHTKSYYHDHKRTLHPIGILLCFMGLLSIAFSITLRLIPNAIPIEALALLNVTPQVLNDMNAMYQYSLIATLVLSGLFVDIIGPRTVLTVAIGIAAICNYYFGRGDSINEVLYARVLINYSHPFILTSVLVLGAHWLPRRHFSAFVGLMWCTLLLTPVLMAPYLRQVATLDDLNSFILDANIVGILVIVVIILTEPIIDRTRHRHDLAGLVRPLKHYKVWLISIVSMIGWMANTFVLQYGTFYLIRLYGFTVPDAMGTVDKAFIFFGCGAVVMGLTSDFFRQKRYIIAAGYFIAAIVFSILFFMPHVPVGAVGPLLYVAAFFTSSTIICYTKVNDYCTIGNSGITLGLLLSITTIGSSFFAKQLHHLLLLYVNDPVTNTSYYWSMILAIIPAILILGTLISIFLLKPAHLHSHTGKEEDAHPVTPKDHR
jgi:predicted MFS family arabinose efflux permease